MLEWQEATAGREQVVHAWAADRKKLTELVELETRRWQATCANLVTSREVAIPAVLETRYPPTLATLRRQCRSRAGARG